MKKFIILTLAMASLFVYSEKSQGAFLIEPYLGTLVSSSLKTNSVASVSCSSDCEDATTGTPLGARVGFSHLGFMLGLDYRMATLDVADADADYSYSHYGLFVGYDFPMMFRVWYTHLFQGQINYELTESGTKNEYTLKQESGSSIGFGYKLIPLVAINLELGAVKYNKLEVEASGASTEADLDIELNTYLLSISFPFTI